MPWRISSSVPSAGAGIGPAVAWFRSAFVIEAARLAADVATGVLDVRPSLPAGSGRRVGSLTGYRYVSCAPLAIESQFIKHHGP